MNSPLILSYNDYSRANAEKKEKVKYGGSNLKENMMEGVRVKKTNVKTKGKNVKWGRD